MDMENGNEKDNLPKKKGRQPENGLAARILDRRLRLLANGFDYRSFAQEYGYTLAMVMHAIHETRKSPLAHEIQKTINTLPLPGEGGGQANIRECL